MIGWDVQDQLFPNVDPIGRVLKIDGYPVKVIGTLAKQGKRHGPEPGQRDLPPADSLQEARRSERRHRRLHQAEGGRGEGGRRTDEVRTILRSLRKTKFDNDDPFGLVTAELLQALWRNISAGAFAS